MKRKNVALGGLMLLLTATSVTGLGGWYSAHRQIGELQAQLTELERQEKRSVVLRSVSQQMEEIALQQKDISDEQREEAIQQTRVANEMRQRSEQERQHAQAAEHAALVSEKKALEAQSTAESERLIAEHQRIQAEMAKRTADTLSYIALGRSLGSLSTVQYRSGNKETADLLSYASYFYTDRYHGDLYYPAVYEALTQSSQSRREWPSHNGMLMGLAFMPGNDNKMVTAGTYGEILFHEKSGDRLNSKPIFKDKNFDFRSLYVHPTNGNIYALSRSGHMVVTNEAGKTQIVLLNDIQHPHGLEELSKDQLLIIGDHTMAVYNIAAGKLTGVKQFDARLTFAARHDHKPLVFDDNGKMHKVTSLSNIQTSNVPVKGNVTAFASSNNNGISAYGMSDGTIYFVDKKGKATKYVGHLSRISKLKFNGRRLYSSSYDGTLNLWVTTSEKPEPMTLLNNNDWITSFTFDVSKNYVWTGSRDGNLSEALISIPMMVDKVQKKLKRNFTPSEWNYFIGSKVPYETFVNTATAQHRKEVRR